MIIEANTRWLPEDRFIPVKSKASIPGGNAGRVFTIDG